MYDKASMPYFRILLGHLSDRRCCTGSFHFLGHDDEIAFGVDSMKSTPTFHFDHGKSTNSAVGSASCSCLKHPVRGQTTQANGSPSVNELMSGRLPTDIQLLRHHRLSQIPCAPPGYTAGLINTTTFPTHARRYAASSVLPCPSLQVPIRSIERL
jgi:hypothetical protein